MPTFKPASFNQLEDNFDKMSLEELKRYNAENDINKLVMAAPERAAQLTFIDNLISFLCRSDKLDESEKVAILTGALLDVKKQIADTYIIRPADNSYVHAQIDKVLGVTAENKMDAVTKQHSHRAYVAFLMHEDYMKEVMKGVEKAELLKLNKHVNPVVQEKHVSTAAAVLKKLQSGSKYHVEVKEKALDNSHVGYDDLIKSGARNNYFYTKKYTPDYIVTENLSDVERDLRLARYRIYMHQTHKLLEEVETFKKSSLHTAIRLKSDYKQPTITDANWVKEIKNRRISDIEDRNYHFKHAKHSEVLLRANRHEFKEHTLHPSIRLFDKSKLKHVEPKAEVVQEQAPTVRK